MKELKAEATNVRLFQIAILTYLEFSARAYLAALHTLVPISLLLCSRLSSRIYLLVR